MYFNQLTKWSQYTLHVYWFVSLEEQSTNQSNDTKTTFLVQRNKTVSQLISSSFESQHVRVTVGIIKTTVTYFVFSLKENKFRTLAFIRTNARFVKSIFFTNSANGISYKTHDCSLRIKHILNYYFKK